MPRLLRALVAVSLVFLAGCGGGNPDAPKTVPYLAKVSFTGSMKPTLQGGEILRIDPTVPFTLIHEHDVIAWRWEAKGLNILHRVIEVGTAANGERYLRTQGDANPAPDDHAIVASEYRGRATMPVR